LSPPTSAELTPLSGKLDELCGLIGRGEKPRAKHKVGVEYEKLGLVGAAREPLRYEGGRASIRGLLEALAERRGWEPMLDGSAWIGVVSKQGASVQLEPGGQVELSGAPASTLWEATREIEEHERILDEIAMPLGIRWIWPGMHPTLAPLALGPVPKRRYAIMDRYLPTRGELARTMMRATCTVQANLDFETETDMGRKLRAAMGLSSVVSAMFANSPLREGRRSGYKSFRVHVWDHLDPDRTGLLRWVFDDAQPSYERYVRYALEVPLFFIERDGRYLDCAGLPFRELLAHGFEGHRATAADWQLHLTTLFPEVRLKTYLEMRGADCVPPALLMALPAVWKGVLYDATALDAGWDLVRRWSFSERSSHREEAARHGLAALAPRGHRTADLARELLEIVGFGLSRQARAAGHDDEGPLLGELARLVERGECPADATLAWFGAGDRKPAEILERYEARWPE
jgi:glutamate--cysteine ligase